MNRKSLLLLAGAAFLGGGLVCNQVFAQVSIASVRFASNTGACTQSKDSYELYDVDRDGKFDQFEIIFKTYVAEQGPGKDIKLRNQNCNITVNLNLPQGIQFSIASVQYLGYADLPAGVTGAQRSEYQFPLHTNTATAQTQLPGPYTNPYDRTDNLAFASMVWSPCGIRAPLSIRTRVSLAGDPALPAAMTLDQVDGTVRQIFGIVWRDCP